MTHATRELLEKGLSDFRGAVGASLTERYSAFAHWVNESTRHGLFQYLRSNDFAPSCQATVRDFAGKQYSGINFASQDYLGLSQHPAVIAAAREACTEFGVHSAGSEPMGGGLSRARDLSGKLKAFTEHTSVVLFPTGWAAGYGAIKGLIRPNDVVILDAFAHDCLQQGANASTGNVTYFAHNDMESLKRRLVRARRNNPEAAILVVTESLFSMDSDYPDFRVITALCREAGAHLMVDCAHDLGLLGPGGKGIVAEAGVLSQVDFLVGSFSKAFANIGGFFASNDKGTECAVRAFSGSYTFSNYLTPPQVAAVNAAYDIISSHEADELRRKTLANAETLRVGLQSSGLPTSGRTSAMVIVPIGSEGQARIAYKRCLEAGLILNCIEYPACRRGEARFRIQVTPRHTPDEIQFAARTVADAIKRAEAQVIDLTVESSRTNCQALRFHAPRDEVTEIKKTDGSEGEGLCIPAPWDLIR